MRFGLVRGSLLALLCACGQGPLGGEGVTTPADNQDPIEQPSPEQSPTEQQPSTTEQPTEQTPVEQTEDPREETPEPDASELRLVELNGAVQKGPFIVGSTIQVANLDASANPTGLVFTTSTYSDLGQFELEFNAGPLVAIEGTGYYYNEATGVLSGAPLTLRALTEAPTLPGEFEAYVNTVTHLTFGRMKTLIRAGSSFGDARTQAEQELQVGLGIVPADFVVNAQGTSMNLLGGNSAANAYLLSVSSALATLAWSSSNGSNADAALQELLNRLALDLESDGELGSDVRSDIAVTIAGLDVDRVEADFAARLLDIGSASVVPDMHLAIDQDGDGLVNAADNCRRMHNPEQEDSDSDGIGDICDDDGLPVEMYCIYVPSIATNQCDTLVYLQCSGTRVDSQGVRGTTSMAGPFDFQGWEETPAFPRPCSSEQANWLTRLSFDHADTPTVLTPIRALTNEEFENLPRQGATSLVLDDELPARLEALAAAN